MSLRVKRLLLGTLGGRAALAIRDQYRLWAAPKLEIGTTQNDQMACRLAVELCPDTGTFVDVGAHIGSVVSEVSFRKPSAKIIAIEAVPSKALALAKKFPRATVYSSVLAESVRDEVFFVDKMNPGCSSLAEVGGSRDEISVRTQRLDDILAGCVVDVLKIDVEGAELGVLRGADNTVASSRPIVMFESGPGDLLGYTKVELFEFFSEREYGLFAPNRVGQTGRKMTLDIFLDSHEYPRRTTNYFALPDESVAEIWAKVQSMANRKK